MNIGVFKRSEGSRIASIDIGSNSVHLSIVEVEKSGMRVLHKQKVQVRLGALLGEDSLLGHSATTVLSDVLAEMKGIADSLRAQVRAIATFALRQARNSREVIDTIYRQTGVSIEIVSGLEEARLIFLGVRDAIPVQIPNLFIVDIGGGSTELIQSHGDAIEESTSLNIGCVRMTQMCLSQKSWTEADLDNLKLQVRLRLQPLLRQFSLDEYIQGVASSGTAKAIAYLVDGLKKREARNDLHNSLVTQKELLHLYKVVCSMKSIKEVKSLLNLNTKRADIIVAGITILAEITQILDIKSWAISRSALREGVLLDTIQRKALWESGKKEDIRLSSIDDYIKKYDRSEKHVKHVAKLSLNIFDELVGIHEMGVVWKEYLRAASLLYDVGKFISLKSYHKHSQYVILNSEISGFTEHDLLIISCIARYHRKRMPKQIDDDFSELRADERRKVLILTHILRIAVALDRSKKEVVQSVSLEEQKSAKNFSLLAKTKGTQAEALLEQHQSTLEVEHLKRMFDINLSIHFSYQS